MKVHWRHKHKPESDVQRQVPAVTPDNEVDPSTYQPSGVPQAMIASSCPFGEPLSFDKSRPVARNITAGKFSGAVWNGNIVRNLTNFVLLAA